MAFPGIPILLGALKTVGGFAAKKGATKAAFGGAKRFAGKAMETLIGKEMLANKGALAARLAPDVFFGGLAAVQTPGDLGDKLIAGGTQAIGGGLGGLTAARGLKKVMPGAGEGLLTAVDFGGSIAGDYAGMAAGDMMMRGKDRVMGGEGLNPYERMGAQQQDAYKAQIERDMMMKLGLINPYQQDYFANENGLAG